MRGRLQDFKRIRVLVVFKITPKLIHLGQAIQTQERPPRQPAAVDKYHKNILANNKQGNLLHEGGIYVNILKKSCFG